MCLAIPARVEKINEDGKIAECDFGGVKREVNVEMLPEVETGEYVVVHVGFAIQKMSEEEAMETYRIFNQLLDMEENKHLLKE